MSQQSEMGYSYDPIAYGRSKMLSSQTPRYDLICTIALPAIAIGQFYGRCRAESVILSFATSTAIPRGRA